jgi:hypothetical protein
MKRPSTSKGIRNQQLRIDLAEAKFGVEGNIYGGRDWCHAESRYEIKRVFARRAGANQGKAELKL